MRLLKITKTAIVCCFALILVSCSKDETPAPPINPDAMFLCQNGFASIYPCSNYDLMGFISIDELGGPGSRGNDCWGWVDPMTQKEYALFCATTGVAFVDITAPKTPIIIGKLPTATISSPWRDIKVYKNHAYIVADAADAHGIQIFDLTRLRNVSNPPEIFSADNRYTGFGSAHNIVINEDSGFAYSVGTSRLEPFAGGPLFINIQNPLAPIDSGGFPGYSHDAQVITYTGPDTEHNGKEILIGSNEIEVVIVDVTDKSNPVEISSISYSNVGYTHQGWFTEDLNYFILGDEIDEQRTGTKTRSIVFDFTDLDNPKLHMEYFGPSEAIDHNGYVKNDLFFLANYTAGVRIIDVSNIENKSMTEIGYFDTHPENNNANFNGAWSVYPYLPSGNIIISDINKGLFIVKKNSN
ncbi:choice-of-anchor B family protein [uncultured Algibacter sp.]|uniref:choice-of-anchor B family protein n=1 Tax=uncultured Algibacter sp. TaxID=298659 RepID=UPI0026041423|nr:choice-of-anchor B family protein [uncultured Algibacter sp.]